MQDIYDKGIYTGFAIVVEMIERGDFATLDELAVALRKRYQGANHATQS